MVIIEAGSSGVNAGTDKLFPGGRTRKQKAGSTPVWPWAPALFLTLFGVGCPKRIETRPPPNYAVEAVLAMTDRADARLVSVKGEARLSVDSPQGKGSTTLFVAAARPGHLHLEQLDFFGKPQAVLVSDGRQFGLYQAQEGRYYRGPATPQNLARFFPLAVSAGALADILLGRAPRLTGEARWLATSEGGEYVAVLRGPPGADEAMQQKLWIDPTSYRVVRSEREGKDGYRLAFGDVQASGALEFPREVVLEVPQEKSRLELRYTQVSLNEPLEEVLFDLAPPEGVPVVELDAQGRLSSKP